MWWYGSSISPLDIRSINLSSRYTENQSLLPINGESISPHAIRRINLSSRYTEKQSLLSLYGESISPLDVRRINLSSRYTGNQSFLSIYGESIPPRDIRRINLSSRYNFPFPPVPNKFDCPDSSGMGESQHVSAQLQTGSNPRRSNQQTGSNWRSGDRLELGI